ncbi:MAG TPA: electron transport complex subunit RsxC [Phycisphaerae bacterium]|jgi:electron transport complex protein RnfC|nr:electron transport complex subunit RsxC [Phycisphaerae bacterium]HPM23849.1 electron transport complex subunit RsxC [Phycisphaerae bacterium]
MTTIATGGLKSFHRGIHPPHRKFTESDPIQLFMPTKELLLPMAQHIGAACTPVVKAGQAVQLGEKIADTDAFVSAPIHASIAGTVGAGTMCLLPAGRRVPALPLKPVAGTPALPADFLQDFLSRDWGGFEPGRYASDEICNAIRAAGIVGQGGATFPTFIKLKKDAKRPVDTVLLNGAECEPYLTADHRLMLECPEAIVVGLQLAMRSSGAERGLICIENNKPDAIETMRKVAAGRPGIDVVVCASKYPMGGERQLIPAVLGRTVPSAPKGLPLDVGVVVVNVATAHTIARAVVKQKPFTHRVVTVTGQGIKKPGNWLVPLGTLLADLFEACGGVTEAAVKVLAGGPMMGPCVPNLNVPIVKGTGGFTVMTAAETARWAETPCIRCGRCIDNCPLHLVPTKIAHAVKHRDYELANRYDLNACCECGCCAFVCPAQIPLPQYIRSGKNQWRILQAKKQSQAKPAAK